MESSVCNVMLVLSASLSGKSWPAEWEALLGGALGFRVRLAGSQDPLISLWFWVSVCSL